MAPTKTSSESNKPRRSDFIVTDVSWLTQAIEKTTDTESLSVLYNNRSASYRTDNLIDKAIEDARECINLSPFSSTGHIQLGLAMEKNDDDSGACEVYMNAIRRSVEPRVDLVNHLVQANNRCHHFSQHRVTLVQLEGSNFCTVCQSTEDVFRCSQCQFVFYCGKPHQKDDWKSHKKVCKQLPEILKEKNEIATLSFPFNIADAVLVKRQFSSLKMASWDDIFEHVTCYVTGDAAKKYMTELLSWPLNMIAALRKFGLLAKSKVHVHVLGAEDSYCFQHLFDQLLSIFPMPAVEIYLIGPELSTNFGPVIYPSASGNAITLYGVQAHYHNYTDHKDYRTPDMIYGCHPGFSDGNYQWKQTLFGINRDSVPSVFTAWNKVMLDRDCNATRDIVEADVAFKEETPFPSMARNLARDDTFHYEVQRMNSFWFGFCGDSQKTGH